VSAAKPTHLLLAVLVVAIWGANAAIGKLAVPQIPVFSFLAFRFFLTGILLLPFVRWQNLPWKRLVRVALLLNVLHYGFVFNAMPHLSASALAIILQVQTPIAVLLGHLAFRERLSVRLCAGILLGFLGLLLVRGFGEVNVVGFALTLAGATAWAVSNIEMKRMGDLALPTFLSITMLISAPILASISVVIGEPVSASLQTANWHQVGGALAYQVIAGSFAMMLWKYLLSANEVQKIVPVTLLQPAFGVIGGMVLFSDKLTGMMIMGGLITAAGVALIQLPQRRKV
jgi:O-acetylserine/cysteine efflux transporter